ncbi:MAG: hypothetical protein K2N51_10465 [Lachnospiraceae bacterium]|nr:hypothetical protein [Lachnospiraceae bacterium]
MNLCLKIKMITFSLGIVFLFFFQPNFAKASTENISTFEQAEEYVNKHQDVNILIYNNNQIIAEYHADGVSVNYAYDNLSRLKEIDYSNGLKEVYSYTNKGVNVQVYQKNKLIENQGIISQAKTNDVFFSKKKYEKTTINKVNMNNLISNKQFRNYKSMTKKQLKKFFKKKESILQYPVKIYGYDKKTNAIVDKNKTIDTSTYIINYCKKYKINPKIIVCLLQKEQSLVTAQNADYNSRRFVYALGYGATDDGDLKKYARFDKQILCATKRLNTLYKKAPKSYPRVMKKINYNRTKKGVYKNYIWIDNKATYVLYKYTPHTIDADIYDTSNEISGGNYLFKLVSKSLFNGKWN